MRTYEMMYVLDPRVSDEEEKAIQSDVKELLTANGGKIVREEPWGRRKLAYEINKLKEGKYTLLYLAGEAGVLKIAEVEYRMRQNDNILRYLTVRTDEDYKRAGMPLPTETPEEPVEEEAAEVEGAEVEGEEPAEAETQAPSTDKGIEKEEEA